MPRKAGQERSTPTEPLTLMLFSGQAASVRRIVIPRPRLRKILWGAGAIAVLIPLLSIDYIRLRSMASEHDRLREEASLQREEIEAYASHMERISDQLVRVGRLDRKLRVMTDLEPEAPLPLPGIGGVDGDGLEPIAVAALTRRGRRLAMTEGLKELQEAATLHEKRLEELVGHLQDKTARLAATPSIAPAKGWITSAFGYRTSPFTGRREFHRGLDIAARKGTPVVSPAEGRVRQVKDHRTLGKAVIVRHGYGVETIYGHLSEVRVKPGETVSRGQTIALMGNTGRSTGPHVHYQVQVNGVPVDPRNYILD